MDYIMATQHNLKAMYVSVPIKLNLETVLQPANIVGLRTSYLKQVEY